MTGIRIKSSPEKLMKNGVYGKLRGGTPYDETTIKEIVTDKVAQWVVEGFLPKGIKGVTK